MGFVAMPTAERLVCLDVETRPDRSRLPGDWGSKFPKSLHHEIVCISYVEAAISVDAGGHERFAVRCCRTGGEIGWTEPRLIEAFWSYFARRPTKLVTWNGRSFDLPVLLHRTMVHGMTAFGYFGGGSRYEGYGHRYATERHCDLMDVLAEHGASARLGLDETAKAMGLPGKVGGHGSEVEAMVEAGDVAAVRAYCEGDVLSLYGLYLRYALLAGRITAAGHASAVEDLAAYLGRERAARPHLGEFLDRWTASDRLLTIIRAMREGGPGDEGRS